MPSLNALGQFKSSFSNIGKEKADMESLNLPYDDLTLPTTDAPPFEFIRNEPPPADDVGDLGLDNAGGEVDLNSFLDNLTGDGSSPADEPVDAPADNAISALDDFLKEITPGSSPPEPEPDTSADDLSSFLGSMQDQGAADTPADVSGTDDFSSFLGGMQDEAAPDVSADDGGIPDDLLSGFSDEMESAPSDTGLPDFGQEDFGAEEPKAAETKPEEIEEDDLGGIDLGGESREAAADTQADADAGLADFNLDTFDSGASSDAAVTPEEPQDDSLDLNGIDLGGESPTFSTEESQDDSMDLNGIDLGGEPPLDLTSETPSDDFSPETASLGDDDATLATDDFSDFSGAGDAGAGDASLDTNFDMPASDADFSTPDADFSAPSADFSAPDADFSGADFSGAGDTPAGDAGAATDTAFDMGDLGADFASDSIEIDTGTGAAAEGEANDSGFSGGDVFGGDDFSLTGLDDILNKTKVSSVPKPVEKKGLFGKKKRKEKEEEVVKTEDNIDEISLSQGDVDNLLHTLTTYPLNLRITCEELIAEQVILPEQLSKLIRLLVNGASVRETADHVELITGKPVVIPKSFEKSSGAAFEAEQSSFAYIFVHNLLPVIRLFTFGALVLFSVLYLSYKFIYIPIKAESMYKRGYERIPVGEYQRANELFHDAFTLHRKKKWFYAYAEAFRDQRRYMLAENKYDELLRYYPRDKKGVLDYAALNTYYLMNYDKANRLLQRELLDYSPNDYDGLLAAGDNFLDWADSNPQKFYDHYEDARFSYARLIEKYGWLPPIIERMLKYFIHTDNLKETLQLRVWFENDPKRRKLSTPTLAELGGYLLDKQLEKTPGTVPDPYIESIESVRNMLLKAVMQDPYLPESHYHLARYYHNLGNTHEERLTLENAIRAFDLAKQESVKRRLYRVDTHYRYANLLINNKEFFLADEQAVRGIELFEDFMNRNLIPPSSQLGQLYALRGDLEYFVKSGNMEAAIANYKKAEGYGYAPPEVQYRMGAAYYQREDWRNALDYLFRASKELPLNRRLLFAMGNAAYQRGDYFAAKGYYDRLLDILETQRIRLPVLLPNDSIQFLETGERLMMARNNAGVVNEALARQTGNREYRSKAMVLYAESSRAWDAITRNPETMTRSRLTDSSGAPSINLGYLNANNALRPTSGYRPQIFVRIDKDALEPSRWEELAPLGGL